MERLPARGFRARDSEFVPPAETVEQFRQAEAVVPGLRENIERSGYTEQELADMFDERVASGEIPAMRSAGELPPSRYLVGSIVLVLVFASLGYFGVLGVLDTHSSSADLPQGWSGAFIGTGVALFVIVISNVAVRRQRRRVR
jgi:hypothetical protein